MTFRVGPFTPPAFEAQRVGERCDRSEAILLLFEGRLRGAARRFQIRSVEDQAAWLAYAELKYLDWRKYAVRQNSDPDNVAVAQGLASANKLKCRPVRYILVYEDGCAVGHCSTWEGLEGVGQVEDLFVHAAYRRRGIGTAMIHHCVETSRARGAGPMVIVVDQMNTAKQMYVALGWRPVALCRQYAKKNRR